MSGHLQDLVSNLLWFGTGTPDVSLVEKVLRPVVVYLVLVVALKMAGKRMLAQLNGFDLVVLLLISNTVQNAIIGNDTSLSGGLVGGLALLAANALLLRVLWRGPATPIRGEGGPSMLWADGAPVTRNLEQFRITIPELEIKAHERGFDTLHEVRSIELAPNGSLTFIGVTQASDSARHQEILARLDALQGQLAALASQSR